MMVENNTSASAGAGFTKASPSEAAQWRDHRRFRRRPPRVTTARAAIADLAQQPSDYLEPSRRVSRCARSGRRARSDPRRTPKLQSDLWSLTAGLKPRRRPGRS